VELAWGEAELPEGGAHGGGHGGWTAEVNVAVGGVGHESSEGLGFEAVGIVADEVVDVGASAVGEVAAKDTRARRTSTGLQPDTGRHRLRLLDRQETEAQARRLDHVRKIQRFTSHTPA